MCDYDSNYINAIPITSRKACKLVRAFTECYDSLKKNGPAARLLHLDDEVSHELVAVIEAHFITIRSGADPDFPENCWDLLLDHAVLTLNLLRSSRMIPRSLPSPRSMARSNSIRHHSPLPAAKSSSMIVSATKVHGSNTELGDFISVRRRYTIIEITSVTYKPRVQHVLEINSKSN